MSKVGGFSRDLGDVTTGMTIVQGANVVVWHHKRGPEFQRDTPRMTGAYLQRRSDYLGNPSFSRQPGYNLSASPGKDSKARANSG